MSTTTTSGDTDALLGKFFKVMVQFVCIMLIVPLADGYVIQKLWGWFMVPQFGISPLTLWRAIGLTLMWTAFAHKPPKKKMEIDVRYIFTGYVVARAIFLLIGKIAFMLAGGA